MNLVRLVQLLQRLSKDHRKRVFTLRDMAALAGEPRPTTAMALVRAAEKGLVGRVGNLWINLLDPPELLEIGLALPSPTYLSFESALYRHGVLSQSPRGALTMATSGRSRFLKTPLGNIRMTHLQPSLFFGFGADRIASPEKAWLDLIYIRGRKEGRGVLTERFYPTTLDRKRLRKLARSFPKWAARLPLENRLRQQAVKP